MCRECWIEYGSPRELPDDVDEAVSLIAELYAHPDGGTGGPLHVLLDDFGVESVRVWDDPDKPFPAELVELAHRIAALMAPMAVEQRAAVLARWERWI